MEPTFSHPSPDIKRTFVSYGDPPVSSLKRQHPRRCYGRRVRRRIGGLAIEVPPVCDCPPGMLQVSEVLWAGLQLNHRFFPALTPC